MFYGPPVPYSMTLPSVAQSSVQSVDITNAAMASLIIHNQGSLNFGGCRYVIDLKFPGIGPHIRWKDAEGDDIEITKPDVLELPKMVESIVITCIQPGENIVPSCVLLVR